MMALRFQVKSKLWLSFRFQPVLNEIRIEFMHMLKSCSS